MHHTLLIAAGILGALGVGLGAFGAHALKATLLESGRAATWDTAVLYHLLHAVALVAIAALLMRLEPGSAAAAWLLRAGYAQLAGTLVFSGSLYVLCLTGTRWLGAITPFGGTMLIGGWLCLVIAATRL